MNSLLADFELRDLRPFLTVGIIVFMVVSWAFAAGRRMLRETWRDGLPGDRLPPPSPGDAREHEVVRRYVRPSEMPPPPLPPQNSSVPPPLSNWQREIERVLRGETAVAPPPRPQSRPAYRAPSPEPYDETTELESAPAPVMPLATMAESAANQRQADAMYEEAASLQERVARRMQTVDAKVKHSVPSAAPVTAAASEAAAVRSWLRQPDTARAALVAVAVFGPPRSMEA